MAKTTLQDLNNHLFEMIERLKDDELAGDRLKEELERARAVDNLSGRILDNYSLKVKTAEMYLEYGLMTTKDALTECNVIIKPDLALENKV
jgi:phage protein|uniref:Phage protein n=1 Tax=Siphoviridae sp. ctt5z12 TaxID=2823604 RepID=A0A8S5LBW3_9CAUD|nr:MAG TPA: hypothetical protein [Siphoviridae sp. ctt5z12]